MGSRHSVVVVTGDVIGEQMAGPAIRAWQFATALSRTHHVELVTSAACSRTSGPGFTVRHVGTDDIGDLLPTTDVWIVQGSGLRDFPAIEKSEAVVVVDLYDPYHLENLELSHERPEQDRIAKVHNATAVLNLSMVRGDFFLAASAKQRDFWLGALAAIGRINPATYDADPSLDSLLAVVPFGVDDAMPVRTGPAIRDVIPGIGMDDKILLWGGGLYNWFDPEILVRAVDRLRSERDDVRLVFMGGKHPNPAVPAMRTAARTQELSDSLGLTGRYVFFNEGWVPYNERINHLLDADIGVSTHLDHVETAFSFRTRILDYLWAGLPVVATDGDVFGELIEHHGLGAAVPAADLDALTDALRRLLADPQARKIAGEASSGLAEQFRWSTAVVPLLDFCAEPRRAPDLVGHPLIRLNLTRPLDPVRAPKVHPGWRGELALAKQYLARGGIGLLARRIGTRSLKLLRGRRD